MPRRSRLFVSLVSIAFTATMLNCVDAALGQTRNMGLQMLQGLSPEQRAAIAQQFGGMQRGGMQGALGAREDQAEEEQLNFILRQQRDALMDAEKQRAGLERLSPFFQMDDWISITIVSSPLPPGRGTRTRMEHAR